jgi:hypothetical protein
MQLRYRQPEVGQLAGVKAVSAQAGRIPDGFGKVHGPLLGAEGLDDGLLRPDAGPSISLPFRWLRAAPVA